ncbi:MAG: DUF4202 domain-containing protein [Phycisphaerales bacterium]|nr:DUF4202 domain-containing protein [Phycisphaerales bacterium]
MGDAERLAEALRRIDDANAEDPRTEAADGADQPRELLFARRVYDWVTRLVTDPSETLLLAARAHTLRRWMVPRDHYPMTNLGYHEWRDACATFHAQEAERILRDVGYPRTAIDRVTALITKQNWESDPEGRTLEDADCLAFLESKLHHYLDEWDEEKAIGILRRTLRKMTPQGRALAATLKLDPRCLELLRRAGA